MSGRSVVLIVDQLEGLFTKPVSLSARNEFLTELADAIDDPSLSVGVVLSLRSDYLHQLDEWLEQRSTQVQHYKASIRPFTPEQAWIAITGPLKSQKLPYDESLIKTIIEDLSREAHPDQSGVTGSPATASIEPPHLSLVCDALYVGGEEPSFTQQAYQNAGLTQGILGQYLSSKLKALGDDGQLGRRILEALTTPSHTKAASCTPKEIEGLVKRDQETVALVLNPPRE